MTTTTTLSIQDRIAALNWAAIATRQPDKTAPLLLSYNEGDWNALHATEHNAAQS